MADNRRCATIAIIGRPNAGKSTLLNTLVGEKIAAVSPKAQTTRTRLIGIVVEGEAQLVLTDTPGLFASKPRNRLEQRMLDDAWGALADNDAIVLLVDASNPKAVTTHEDMLAALLAANRPLYVALNKVDATPKEQLLTLASAFQEKLNPRQMFMISASGGTGLKAMVEKLSAAASEGPWLYEGDDITSAPLYELAAEATREQLYLQLGQELPYDTTVLHEKWEKDEKGVTHIHQQIVVARDSQKGMVIGKAGSKLKSIGTAARNTIEKLLQARIHLVLHVKVIEDWQDKKAL